MKRACVLLPALNEAATVGRIVDGIRSLVIPDLSITVLVVDDGSTDGTGDVALQHGAEVLTHPINRGVGAAFRTGLEWAIAGGFDCMIHMDADGQLLVREMPAIITPVLNGTADAAIGSRFRDSSPQGLSAWKSLSLQLISWIISRLTGARLRDISCGYRCLNRKAMLVLRPSSDRDYVQESLLQVLAHRLRVVEIPVTVIYEQGSRRRSLSDEPVRYSLRFLRLTARGLLGFARIRLRGKAR